MYRRIQPKTSVDVSETQGFAYAGYPDLNNGDCIDAYPGAATVMTRPVFVGIKLMCGDQPRRCFLKTTL